MSRSAQTRTQNREDDKTFLPTGHHAGQGNENQKAVQWNECGEQQYSALGSPVDRHSHCTTERNDHHRAETHGDVRDHGVTRT